MKQTEILAAALVGIFIAILSWVITTNFIAKPEERFEDITQIRPFTSEFSQEAKVYLKDDGTTIYTVDIDVEDAVGTGNEAPFTGR